MKSTTMTASKDLIDKILRVSNQDMEMLSFGDKTKSVQDAAKTSECCPDFESVVDGC
jgi:hypothetical protein